MPNLVDWVPGRKVKGTALIIDYLVTADMDDGQPLPPLIEDRVVWHVVCRANGLTKWRRIFLKKSTIHAQRRRARGCF